MARPFTPDPNAITLTEAYDLWPVLDRKTDHAPRNEAFTWPGVASNYTIRLDYAILEQTPLTIKAGSVELLPVRWTESPGPAEVAVHLDLGLVRVHPSIAGQAGEVDYTPLGSVLDAQWQSTLQQAVVQVQTDPNVARLDVVNEFLERPIFRWGEDIEEAAALQTVDDPVNASRLTGTVPLARMHANIARRDQANTLSQLLTTAGLAFSGQQILNSNASSDNVYPVGITDTILSYNSNNAHKVVFNLPDSMSVPGGKIYLFHARPGGQNTASHVQPIAGQSIFPGVAGAPLVLPTAWHCGAILWSAGVGWHFWKLGNW